MHSRILAARPDCASAAQHFTTRQMTTAPSRRRNDFSHEYVSFPVVAYSLTIIRSTNPGFALARFIDSDMMRTTTDVSSPCVMTSSFRRRCFRVSMPCRAVHSRSCARNAARRRNMPGSDACRHAAFSLTPQEHFPDRAQGRAANSRRASLSRNERIVLQVRFSP